jgi:hypothetical protein
MAKVNGFHCDNPECDTFETAPLGKHLPDNWLVLTTNPVPPHAAGHFELCSNACVLSCRLLGWISMIPTRRPAWPSVCVRPRSRFSPRRPKPRTASSRPTRSAGTTPPKDSQRCAATGESSPTRTTTSATLSRSASSASKRASSLRSPRSATSRLQPERQALEF